MLHPITSPKLYIHKAINLFPRETVLAAIEVKSNLNDIKAIMDSCRKVKELKNTIDHEIENRFYIIPYIVFGYTGNQIDTILAHIKEKQEEINNFVNFPDVILVLSENKSNDYCLIKKECWTRYSSVDDLYIQHKDKKALLAFYEYLLDLIDLWSGNIKEYSMPIRKYITEETYNSLDDW